MEYRVGFFSQEPNKNNQVVCTCIYCMHACMHLPFIIIMHHVCACMYCMHACTSPSSLSCIMYAHVPPLYMYVPHIHTHTRRYNLYKRAQTVLRKRKGKAMTNVFLPKKYFGGGATRLPVKRKLKTSPEVGDVLNSQVSISSVFDDMPSPPSVSPAFPPTSQEVTINMHACTLLHLHSHSPQ